MVVYAYTCILSCFGLFIMPKRKGVSGMVDVHSEEYILGQNIRKYRIQKGWSQKQLSDAVNIDRAEISRIENGERGAMSCTLLRRFAKALGVSMDELMGEDEESDDMVVQHQRKFEQLDPNNQNIIDQMTDALLLKQRFATA